MHIRTAQQRGVRNTKLGNFCSLPGQRRSVGGPEELGLPHEPRNAFSACAPRRSHASLAGRQKFFHIPFNSPSLRVLSAQLIQHRVHGAVVSSAAAALNHRARLAALPQVASHFRRRELIRLVLGAASVEHTLAVRTLVLVLLRAGVESHLQTAGRQTSGIGQQARSGRQQPPTKKVKARGCQTRPNETSNRQKTVRTLTREGVGL